MSTPLRIAIIGNGPRALSVLERLAARLIAQPETAVEIHYIDRQHPGSGRIWRQEQSHLYVMNTVAEEVSAFSGVGEVEQARPGAGPSLAGWWQHFRQDYPGENAYAPRALHGEYMQFVLQSIERALSPVQRLCKRVAEVVDIVPAAESATLHFQHGEALSVDRVVIATGHVKNRPAPHEQQWLAFAERHPALCWIPGDSAADLPLDEIAPQSKVGIIGLGLSFLDVMSALTLGRGGRFSEQTDGTLRYHPSGREPALYAGSRSSLPIPGRGKNQKHHDFRYQSVLFTAERADTLAQRGQVGFNREVLPLLMAEVHLTYYATALRQRFGENAEREFRQSVAALEPTEFGTIPALAERFGITDMPELDLGQLANPFREQRFISPRHFHGALQAEMERDYQQACEGNVDNPLKAALDTLRDTRGLIRKIVDFGGLTPDSYRDEFIRHYSPVSALLSAGPPRYRTRQMLALIDAGVLHIVGPQMQIACDAERESFVLSSPQVENSDVAVQTLLDARVPSQDITRDESALTQALLARGIYQNFINTAGTAQFATGGVAVSRAPFHPLACDGKPLRQLYVIGIPSEHTRWFMSAGSSRPGYWTDFVCDADAIAQHILMASPADSVNQEATL